MIPVISTLRSRAQRAQCTANLHSLYVGANLFVQQTTVGRRFLAVLPHAIHRFCECLDRGTRTVRHFPEKLDLPHDSGAHARPRLFEAGKRALDYMPMPFDDKPTTPHQWPRQPWFVEVGDVHGNGNLIIFTDGSVSDLKTVAGRNQSRR